MASSKAGDAPEQAPNAADADAPREIELKLAMPEEALLRLQRAGAVARLGGLTPKGRAAKKRLEATYFDTADRALARAGIGLRVRLENGRPVQTVKADDTGLSLAADRLEAETALPPDTACPQLHLVEPESLRSRLQEIIGDAPLAPVFTTRVDRTARLFTAPVKNGKQIVAIEAAFDAGEIEADGRTAPVSELELELKRGDPEALYCLARALARTYPVMPVTESKAARGYRLADNAPPGRAKSGPITLPPGTDLPGAYASILEDCIAHVTANAPAIVQARDPEGIHQMRVSLRRMRSAISTFKTVLHAEGGEALADRARALFRLLGDARDFDVFCTETLPAVGGEPAGDLKPLAAAAEEIRAERWDKVVKAVASQDFACFVLDAAGYAALVRATPADDLPSLERYAEARLDKRYKSAAKRARRLGHMDNEQRHDLRKRLKKLRYEMEFFAPLFDRDDRKPFLKALRKLQKVFGAMNDAVVAAHVAREAAVRIGSTDAAAAAGYAAGWLAARGESEFSKAGRRWKKLKKISPFWRS